MDELTYLSDVFVQNGYPATVVHRILFEEKEKDNSWHFGGKLIQKKNIQE